MSSDIDAGNAAEVLTICVASGLAQKNDLLYHNPDILVDYTNELLN